MVASLNLVIGELARETAEEVESVRLVEAGHIPSVLEEDLCEHGVDVADALDAPAQRFDVGAESVDGSPGV
jgi:hypothetical protein